MSVKEHYDNHLGNFYCWMIGDFEPKVSAFQKLLTENFLLPAATKIAIDLGAGNGIQSVALAKLGYKVIAIDFNNQLLEELRKNSEGLTIEVIEDDIISRPSKSRF